MSNRPFLLSKAGALGHQDSVYPATLTTPPSASLDAPGTVFVNTAETYTSTSSDPGGSVVEHSWEFSADAPEIDDTASGESVTYTVPSEVNTNQTMTVTLTVKDDAGATDTTTTNVTVKADFRNNLHFDLPLDQNPLQPEDDNGGSYSLGSSAEIVSDSVRGNVVQLNGGHINSNFNWATGSKQNIGEVSTWSWWVKMDDPAAEDFYFYYSSGYQENGRLRWTGDKFMLQSYAGQSNYTNSLSPFDAGTWHHVVLRRHDHHDPAYWWEIWVDGQRIARNENRYIEWRSSGTQQMGRGLTGKMSDARSYVGLLSEDEIDTLYKVQQP